MRQDYLSISILGLKISPELGLNSWYALASAAATIDPTLGLCTRYPLQLGGQRQCEIRSLPDTSAHDKQWESNPSPYQ